MRILPLHRIFAIGLFSLIYIAAGSAVLHNNTADIAFIVQELQGLKYHRSLMQVFTALQEKGGRQSVQQEIQKTDALFSTDPSVWLDISAWKNIREHPTVSGVQNLMQDVGDKSNLILDPQLSSYYLMNILVNIVPPMADTLTQNAPPSTTFQQYKKTLERSLSIIERDDALKKQLHDALSGQPWNSISNLRTNYATVHDALRQALVKRLDEEQRLRLYTLIFLALVYISLVASGILVVRNHIAASEIKAAREKQTLLENLEKTNNELEQFAYVASHDLKEPVRMVANFATLLAQSYNSVLDDTGKLYTSMIVDSAKRMEQMIADLLSYARLENESGHPPLCDCEKHLQSVLTNLQPLIEEYHAVIISTELPTIRINPARFIRLLQNLISNAIRYRDPARTPEIVISARREADDWHFSVQDNGIGISPQYAQQIFEPFRRLHNHSHSEGTGIGLAICKKIVERGGGKIWVKSRPGSGSTFHFTLSAKSI